MEQRLPKLIVCDIDGTLVNTERDMDEITRNTLNILHKQGVLFGVASGRQIDSKMFGYPKKWGLDFDLDVCIGMNGGQYYVKDEGNIHNQHMLSKETLKKIITMMERFDLNPYMYRGEAMICKRIDPFMVDSVRRNRIPSIVVPLQDMYDRDNFKVMYKIEEEHMDEVVDYVNSQKDDSYIALKTQPIMLEFQSPKINKGEALACCCDLLKMDLKDVMAFGDMDNDLELLEVAGWGVAVKNATKAVKAIAQDICLYDCDHDAVGRYLKSRYLK